MNEDFIKTIFGEKNIEHAHNYNDELYIELADFFNLDYEYFEMNQNEEYQNYYYEQKNKGYRLLNISLGSDLCVLSGKEEDLEIFKFIVKNNFNEDLQYID